MNNAETPLCPIFGHNLIRLERETVKTQSIECKSCDSKLESSLNANLDVLSDVQIEVKRTIRELFLLNHRRNRKKALARSMSA